MVSWFQESIKSSSFNDADHEDARDEDGVHVAAQDVDVDPGATNKVHDPLMMHIGPLTRTQAKKYQQKLATYLRAYVDKMQPCEDQEVQEDLHNKLVNLLFCEGN